MTRLSYTPDLLFSEYCLQKFHCIAFLSILQVTLIPCPFLVLLEVCKMLLIPLEMFLKFSLHLCWENGRYFDFLRLN